jgi:hypothetical protein
VNAEHPRSVWEKMLDLDRQPSEPIEPTGCAEHALRPSEGASALDNGLEQILIRCSIVDAWKGSIRPAGYVSIRVSPNELNARETLQDF